MLPIVISLSFLCMNQEAICLTILSDLIENVTCDIENITSKVYPPLFSCHPIENISREI